ncbi:MAG: iduronate sulfatase, partial [Pseudomonadota bacterium]
RFWNQAAVRVDNWKYLIAGDKEYLFDLSAQNEDENLIATQPEVAQSLRTRLSDWSNTLSTPGMPDASLNNAEEQWYEHYLGALEP